MAEAQQEENHWPGFVDALSTIVMVVTFLLIILAVAIFAMSLSIARNPEKDDADSKAVQTSTNLEETASIEIEADPVKSPLDPVSPEFVRSDDFLRLTYALSTIAIDEASRNKIRAYFDRNDALAAGRAIDVTAYFDSSAGGYTKQRRISYYRVLNVRNVLIEKGFETDRIEIHVRPAPSAEKVNAVEISLQ